MAHLTEDLVAAAGRSRGDYSAADTDAWVEVTCARCGSPQMVVVLRSARTGVRWLRCPSCLGGSVLEKGVVSPGASPVATPGDLPEDLRVLWTEVQHALVAGAPTAVAALCRTLLVHVAVGQGLPADPLPSVAEAVAHLEAEGHLTRLALPHVGTVVAATDHAGIAPVAEDAALTAARFTHQVLTSVHSYPAQLARHG